MSIFSGKQYRGAMRAHRALKREEAEARAVRAERTPRPGPAKAAQR